IDLHDCRPGTVSVPTRPFQIPLGALVPVAMANLLPAAKNIGTTHITNGAYRLHPVEWAVGEASAALAVFCLRVGAAPQEVHARGIRRWQNSQGHRSAGPEAAAIQPGSEDAATLLRWAAAATLVTNAIPGAAAPPHPGDNHTVTRADLALWLGGLLREAIETGADL